MAHIVVLPFPEPGHFMPTLRIAGLLRDAGHSVTYLSLPEFGSYFVAQGFGFFPILQEFVTSQGAHDVFTVRNPGDVVMKKLIVQAVLRHTGRSGILRLLGVDLGCLQSSFLLCDVLMYKYLREGLLDQCGERIMLFDTSLPLMPDSGVEELVLCPGALEIPGAAPDSSVRTYVEPSVCRVRPKTNDCWPRLDGSRPLVYCSFGTQVLMYPPAAKVAGAVIRAFRSLPSMQLVMSLGALDLNESLELPDNVTLTRSAPQLELLQRASLFISHGGLGGIKESLLEAVPIVAIPFNADQPANGRRLEFHGIGRMVMAEDCDSASMASLIESVIDDSGYAERLGAMAEIFREMERNSPSLRSLNARLESLC